MVPASMHDDQELPTASMTSTSRHDPTKVMSSTSETTDQCAHHGVNEAFSSKPSTPAPVPPSKRPSTPPRTASAEHPNERPVTPVQQPATGEQSEGTDDVHSPLATHADLNASKLGESVVQGQTSTTVKASDTGTGTVSSGPDGGIVDQLDVSVVRPGSDTSRHTHPSPPRTTPPVQPVPVRASPSPALAHQDALGVRRAPSIATHLEKPPNGVTGVERENIILTQRQHTPRPGSLDRITSSPHLQLASGLESGDTLQQEEPCSPPSSSPSSPAPQLASGLEPDNTLQEGEPCSPPNSSPATPTIPYPNPFKPAVDRAEEKYVTDMVRFLDGTATAQEKKLPELHLEELRDDVEQMAGAWAGIDRSMGYPQPNVSYAVPFNALFIS